MDAMAPAGPCTMCVHGPYTHTSSPSHAERTHADACMQVCVVSLGALHFKGIAEPVEVLQAKLM